MKKTKRLAASDCKTIGELIRYLRDRAGLRQDQLADAIGLDTGYIGHLENDRREGSPKTLIRIGRYLGLARGRDIFAPLEQDAADEFTLILPVNLTVDDLNKLRQDAELMSFKRKLEDMPESKKEEVNKAREELRQEVRQLDREEEEKEEKEKASKSNGSKK